MTQAGNVYGQALYDLAKSEELTQKILQQLQALQESFAQEPDFLRLLAMPRLTKQERCQILEDSFREKIHPYVLNFLKILTEKGYIRYFPDCCTMFRQLYDRDNGILRVTAVTAVALTEAQTGRLEEKLSAITGKTVALTNRVDERCIGGVRLDYDGKQLDDTLAHRLDALRGLLKNTVL